ncbi:SDR family NAD(P)-dependent oxidoreductase [Streptomyces caeni]|uniref:SDR family NAD(P)-dependent oxidoreductase n=1 Tax=Streptomyces caeni TaxID=2307231 RepID=A0ABW4IQP5_9ACTN
MPPRTPQEANPPDRTPSGRAQASATPPAEPRRTHAGTRALVTGAAQGIGRAIAARLAADGALVAVNDRVPGPRLDEVADAVGGVRAPADVSDRALVRDLVARLSEEIGDIDVLVCNAAYMTMGELATHDEDDWWKVVDTNLTGTFHLVQAVLPGMRRRGRGRIVVVSSEWGVTGWPGATAYAASKAGLISLTKSLGRELAPQGILVNAVAPGVTDTPQLRVDAEAAGLSLDEMRRSYAAGIPLGRIGRPEEIAAAVALLTDFRIGSLVGQTLQINGGTTRCRA